MLLFYELHVEQLMNPDGHTLRITDPKMQENTDLSFLCLSKLEFSLITSVGNVLKAWRNHRIKRRKLDLVGVTKRNMTKLNSQLVSLDQFLSTILTQVSEQIIICLRN